MTKSHQEIRRENPTLSDRFTNGVFRLVLGICRVLPYQTRLRFFGFVVRKFIAPVANFERRITDNINLVRPNLSDDERKELTASSLDNMARSVIETYSGEHFIERCADLKLSGPGAQALEATRDAGKPAVIVTGHIGNYDSFRAALRGQGYDLHALYRPMNNGPFNEHYVKAMNKVGPAYSNTKAGLAKIVRHLKSGGMALFLIDQAFKDGERLSFLGHTAMTTTTPAKLAKSSGAQIFTVYGLRKENGIDFDIHVNGPFETEDPIATTQALNDDLESIMANYQSQWLWVHRRWKTWDEPV